VLYLVAWVRYSEADNSWEPDENIIDDYLIDDYETRMAEAETEQAAEDAELIGIGEKAGLEEGEVEVGEEEEGVEAEEEEQEEVVDASAVEAVSPPVKVLSHKVYPFKNRDLTCVWVRLLHSDGSKTKEVVASLPLGATKAGLVLLRAYVRTKNGAKVAKYMPF
jgi:hypothetical protein